MKHLFTLGVASVVCGLLASPALAAGKSSTRQTTTGNAAMRNAWPPESLSGTITMVDPARNLLVVAGPDQVPYDMVITHKTRIQSGDQPVSVNNLMDYKDKPVSIRFVPERKGDVAESIHIDG